jgi:chaperone modulatory protein CbpM
MAPIETVLVRGIVVEEQMAFTLTELCRACNADAAQLGALVEEGVLEPAGTSPEDWHFTGLALGQARRALRLGVDLDLNPAATAVVMELVAQIAELRAELRRAGLR